MIVATYRIRSIRTRRLAAVAGAALTLAAAGALPACSDDPRPAAAVAAEPGGETVAPPPDHGGLSALLAAHVKEGGWVDYAALARESGKLDAYLELLADTPVDRLERSERLATLLNAYNAFTLRLILDHYDGGKLDSIRDIPDRRRWDDRRWKLGERTLSLNEIEHDEIRPKFEEPRIHFALVCAAVGCPPLRGEAYTGARLEQQLDEQTRTFHSDARWHRFDAANGTAYLSKLYDWYGGDFEKTAGSILKYAAQYDSTLREALESGRDVRTRWIDYDWELNDVKKRP